MISNTILYYPYKQNTILTPWLARAGRFSDAAFERKFLAALEPVLPRL